MARGNPRKQRPSSKLGLVFEDLSIAIKQAFEECLAESTPITQLSQATSPEALGTQTPTPDDRDGGESTFSSAQKSDRGTAVTRIGLKMRSDQGWPSRTLKERMMIVFREYDTNVQIRAFDTTKMSGKRDYPDQYDRKADLKWVVRNFVPFLKEPEEENKKKDKGGPEVQVPEPRSRSSEDEDDEEPPLPKESEKPVKTEEGVDDGRSNKGEDGENIAVGRPGLRPREKAEVPATKPSKTAKRKLPTMEQPGAKKVKLEGDGEGAGIGEEATTSEDDDKVPEDKRVYTAVPRGMAISNISRARHDRAVGWPWSEAAKAAKARIVIVGQDGAKKS